MESDLLILKQFSTRTHTIEANLFVVWADSVKPEYPGEIQTQDQLEFFRNLQRLTFDG